MLERLLEHLRYAAALKACSEQARHPAERRLLMTLATVHEAKSRKMMQRVKQVGLAKAAIEKVPERGRRDPATGEGGTQPRTASSGRSRFPMLGTRSGYR
jgi:hypothetical protein